MIHQFYLPDYRSFLFDRLWIIFVYYFHKVYTVPLIIYLYIYIIFLYFSIHILFVRICLFFFFFIPYLSIYISHLSNQRSHNNQIFPRISFPTKWTKECTCYRITHNAFLFYCSSLKEREKTRRASEFQESNIINESESIRFRIVMCSMKIRRGES